MNMEEVWKNAPEGAQYYSPEDGMYREGFYKKDEGGHWHFYPTDSLEHGYTWLHAFNPQGSRNRVLIPRPKEWKSSDDGLPPIGIVCQWFVDELASKRHHGTKVKILSYPKKGYVCVEGISNNPDNPISSPFVLWLDRVYFVSYKTDKEETISKASDLLEPCVDYKEELGILYDAGMLKLPEKS